MSVWRDRGYVPDSDDDDDGDDVNLDFGLVIDHHRLDIPGTESHGIIKTSEPAAREDQEKKIARTVVVGLHEDVFGEVSVHNDKLGCGDKGGDLVMQDAIQDMPADRTIATDCPDGCLPPPPPPPSPPLPCPAASALLLLPDLHKPSEAGGVNVHATSSSTTTKPNPAEFELPSVTNQTASLRRASVSSSDLSDVDDDVLSSSPHAFFRLASSFAAQPDPHLTAQGRLQHQLHTGESNRIPGYSPLTISSRSTSEEAFRILAAPARSFRTRKAIQLHPYQIESERYRKVMKARGYRPVQVALPAAQTRENYHESQSQSFDNQPSIDTSRTQETTPPHSVSSSARSTAAPQFPQPPLLRLDDSDDEAFSDASVNSQRRFDGGVQQGHKRRKTVQGPIAGRLNNDVISSTSGTKGKLKSLGLVSRTTSLAGVLPSPPHTSSPSVPAPHPAAVPRFRRPRGLTPPSIITSMPSSPSGQVQIAPTAPQIQELDDSDSVESDDDVGDAAINLERSVSPDPGIEQRQLMRMRRRIKGVLPASWLKLDKQAQRQTNSPITVNQQDTPRYPEPVKGVAQRVASNQSATPVRQRATIPLSNESDDSDTSFKERSVANLAHIPVQNPQQGYFGSYDHNGEVEEHDEIDRMLPHTQRPRRKKGHSKKRQSILTDGYVIPAVGTQHQSGISVPSRSRTIPGAIVPKRRLPVKKRSSRKRPAQLSILDAAQQPEISDASSKQQPAFVRLAARQVRKRRDLGRHSPTRKHVRLATREDTHEALAPLRAWRAGTLYPTHHSADDLPEPSLAHGIAALPRPSSVHRTRIEHERVLDQTPTLAHQLRNDYQRGLRNRGQQARDSTVRIRPGQLETPATESMQGRDLLTFAPQQSRLMQIFRHDIAQGAPSKFRLERFLQDREDADKIEQQGARMDTTDTVVARNADATTMNPKRRRKGQTRRLDVELVNYRQPHEPLPVAITHETINPSAETAESGTLQGLGPFGTQYSTNFDVRPLEIGTYFQKDTFVGSGALAQCISIRDRDLDVSAGRITIKLSQDMLQWSAWNEDVSAGLTKVFATCRDGMQTLLDVEHDTARQNLLLAEVSKCISYLLRSVVQYCSGCLFFLDPVDRLSCVVRLSKFRDDFVDMMQDKTHLLTAGPYPRVQVDQMHINALLSLACLSFQINAIAQHPFADVNLQNESEDALVQTCRRAFLMALPSAFTLIQSFLEDHRRHIVREMGIKDDQPAIACIVIVNNLLQATSTPVKLSDLIHQRLEDLIGTSWNILTFDRIWYDTFTLQPLLEIDDLGIHRPGRRFSANNDNWRLIKTLLLRLFELYPASSRIRNPTLNDYLRACLTRIYNLIVRWGWRRCEASLSTVYDFFARNGLSQPAKEETRGSPRFLEELDEDPTIHVDNRDCSFHIFLKLLVVGLQGMQAVYPKQKVRGFAWRFIPNHGRTYRKDQEINQADLDALRNHHDLLCTLYWVLPSGAGPRLQMLQDLVDHATSHREACRLSVHAWKMLARYQMSREQPKDVNDLAAWFKEMTSVTILQYRLARPEAESQFATERAKGSTEITQETLERTIVSNQRGILATLLDLLGAMKSVVQISKSWSSMRNLVEAAELTEVFKLFDISHPKLFDAISQVLDIVEVILNKSPKPKRTESQQRSEESQDYGDWSHLDDAVEPGQAATEEDPQCDVAFLHEPLSSLLSTSFGSEKSAEDELLQKTVNVWTKLAHVQVSFKIRDWSSYLHGFSANSWFQLRDTEQKRKYTAYFLSTVIEIDESVLGEHRTLFLESWLISLLERESLLKYQHRLTNNLLNSIVEDPLLDNLPFAAHSRTARFQLSLIDLRERRLSLLDCILSNMHASRYSADLNRAYADMLRKSMTFMRKNYEDLQESSMAASDGYMLVRGAYVSFVQHVISLMQQYTVDICPIDRFFVDSSVFPLPATDPSYVVGRLKNYAFKLDDSRTRKQLAVFLQTVSERAAIDNEQAYLVRQLHGSLTGKASGPLRHIIVLALFPAYLELSVTTACGWILMMPLIEAVRLAFKDLQYGFDITMDAPQELQVMTCALHQLYYRTHSLVHDKALLTRASDLRLITRIFELVQSMLTIVDYVRRRSGQGQDASKMIVRFVSLGKFLLETIDGNQYTTLPDRDDLPMPPNTQYLDMLEFSRKNLSEEINRHWIMHGHDDYVVMRGREARRVVIDIGLAQEEKAAMVDAVKGFMHDYDAVFRRVLIRAVPDFSGVFL